MLDWDTHNRFMGYGLDRAKQHTVNLKDVKPLPRDFVTPTLQRSRQARKSTVLGALYEDSYRKFESDFDQSKIRQAITLEKSMFKRRIRVKQVFQDDNWLKSVLVGDEPDE